MMLSVSQGVATMLALLSLVSTASAAVVDLKAQYGLECKEGRTCVPVIDAQGNVIVPCDTVKVKSTPSPDDDDDDNDRDLGENPKCPMDANGKRDCDTTRGYTWGDPHLTTFDGVKVDCQTLGDHVYMKSRNPAKPFEFHARYGQPWNKNKFLAWIVGVAISEAYDGAPLVEVSLDTPFTKQDGTKYNCDSTILLDGVEVTQDPSLSPLEQTQSYADQLMSMKGIGPNEMSISQLNPTTLQLVFHSGLTVKLQDRTRSHFGCSLTTSVFFPNYLRDDWKPYGLMGTPDGVRSNDWTIPDDTVLPIPGGGRRKINGKVAARYCREWCIKEQANSLFYYEPGSKHDFSYWQQCDAGPAGGSNGGDNDAAQDAWLKFIDEIIKQNPEFITMCVQAAIEANNPKFDQQDCLVELVGGSDIALILQEFKEEYEGGLLETGTIACGDWSKPGCVQKFGANVLFDKKFTKHSVACCKTINSYEPVEGHNIHDGTGCIAKANYNDAETACTAMGATLCSKEEVEGGALTNAVGQDKCNLDNELVWTRSSTPGNLVLNQWKLCGKSGGCSGGIGQLVDGQDPQELAYVRCCSKKPILGWKTTPCDGIFTLSDFGGMCSGRVKYDQAVEFCTKEGGYLCSKKELTDNCAKGGGCGYDNQFVWAMDQSLVEGKKTDEGKDPMEAFEDLDKLEKKWLACGDLSNLDCVKNEGATKVVDVVSEKHEVRCCRKSDPTLNLFNMGWLSNGDKTKNHHNLENPKCADIWAMSKVGSPALDDGCVHAVNYTSAEGYCTSKGGVVCDLETVQNGCTKHTGCGHDADLVWTSDTVDETTISPQKMAWVTCGRKSRCSGHFGKGAFLSDIETPHEVRCCSNTFQTGWKHNSGCDVWGESDILGNCYHAETYKEALEVCKLAGAELCTKEQLLADCTAGSGCGHDWDFVWSKDRGWNVPYVPPPDTRATEDKVWLACGDVDNKKCWTDEGMNEHLAPVSEKHEFVCCSGDTGLTSPWVQSSLNSCNVFSTGKDPSNGQCYPPMTFADAEQVCSALSNGNGRLCSRQEVMQRCVKDAAKACSNDGDLLWTSEMHDEATQGALKEVRWLSCGRKGKCGELHGANSMMVDHTLLEDPQYDQEVRCCSDFPIPGWVKNSGCDVWGESDIGVNNACMYAANYQEAQDACAVWGARLCEKDELLKGCTAGSGCGHDWDLIWSKTPAFLPPEQTNVVEEKFVKVACGSAGGVECEKFEGGKEFVVSSYTKHEVRCCSDFKFDDSWEEGCSGLFSKSKLPVCHHSSTYEQAKQTCAQYTDGVHTARLCTVDEVKSGCTDNSNLCGHNSDLLWTNEEVDKSTVTLVERKQTVCGRRDGNCRIGAELVDPNDTSTATSNKAAVRCCSSKAMLSWTDAPDCPGIWTESNLLGGRCFDSVTWDTANQVCTEAGGRLCTKSELVSNCSRSGGCGHDYRLTWALDSVYVVA